MPASTLRLRKGAGVDSVQISLSTIVEGSQKTECLFVEERNLYFINIAILQSFVSLIFLYIFLKIKFY